MAIEIPPLVSSQVAEWQREHHTVLIQAYPPDWDTTLLYAEWEVVSTESDDPYKKRKKNITTNGFSHNPGPVEALRQRLIDVQMLAGVTIDQVYFSKKHRTLTTLWHLPTGPRVRKFGSAPLPETSMEK